MQPNPAAPVIRYTTAVRAGIWLRRQSPGPGPALELQELTPKQQATLDAYIGAASPEFTRLANAARDFPGPEETAPEAIADALLHLLCRLAAEASVYTRELRRRIQQDFLKSPDDTDPHKALHLTQALHMTARSLSLQAEAKAELANQDHRPGKWQPSPGDPGAGDDWQDDYEDADHQEDED